MTALRTKQAVLIYSLLLMIGVLYLFPVYWTFITSVKTVPEMMSGDPTLIPRTLTPKHYVSVIFNSRYFTWVRNSMVIGVAATLITMLLALGAGYSVSRLRFPGRRLLEMGVLVVYLFPGILLVIPLFQVMSSLGLYDRLSSVILAHVLLGLPFGTWTVRSFIGTIPSELDDAARIDGATRLRTLFSVYLPIIAPGLATVGIFTFVVSWNDYLFPVVLLSSPEVQTISVGIAGWTSAYSINWGQISGAAIMSVIPVVVFYALAGRYFVSGLSAGAVKG